MPMTNAPTDDDTYTLSEMTDAPLFAVYARHENTTWRRESRVSAGGKCSKGGRIESAEKETDCLSGRPMGFRPIVSCQVDTQHSSTNK